jgi:hypothetical protein
MKKELRNPFGKISLATEFDEANDWVYNNWQGYQTKDSVMAGANLCLEVLLPSGCPYLLNDNRLVTGPWDDAVDWIAQNWTPRAIAAGLTHFAQVVSPETFAALSGEMMHSRIGTHFQMRVFSRIEEAQAWLQQEQAVAA